MNRPLDPRDLIALALADTSGCSLDVARREAEPLLAFLEDHGAHIAYGVSLPTEVKRGREGRLDLTDFTEAVLALFLTGPLDTFSLNTVYADRSSGLPGLYPKRSWDTPRKRLSELERAGFVRQVRDADGQVTRKHHGVSYGVWEITDKGRQAVDVRAAA